MFLHYYIVRYMCIVRLYNVLYMYVMYVYAILCIASFRLENICVRFPLSNLKDQTLYAKTILFSRNVQFVSVLSNDVIHTTCIIHEKHLSEQHKQRDTR